MTIPNGGTSSNESIVSEDNKINNLEQKKWMIGLMQFAIQSAIQASDSTKQEWSPRFHEAYPNLIKDSRNKKLAFIAFIVTALFGLNDFLNVESLKIIYYILIIILSISALVNIHFRQPRFTRCDT
jgi:hypothetical protein